MHSERKRFFTDKYILTASIFRAKSTILDTSCAFINFVEEAEMVFTHAFCFLDKLVDFNRFLHSENEHAVGFAVSQAF